ncbi:MAG: PilZ domain-containing protein [Terriglobia bacterium]|nr:PilZ domain-containing protein [Terriglobia bacterium]
MSKQKFNESPRPVRRYIRRKLDMRVRILTQAEGVDVVHGRCITISEGGFGAILTQELPEQKEVWVEFRSPNLVQQNQIRAEVRQAKGFHYGFQFVSPDQQARSFIRRLVAQGTDSA